MNNWKKCEQCGGLYEKGSFHECPYKPRIVEVKDVVTYDDRVMEILQTISNKLEAIDRHMSDILDKIYRT